MAEHGRRGRSFAPHSWAAAAWTRWNSPISSGWERGGGWAGSKSQPPSSSELGPSFCCCDAPRATKKKLRFEATRPQPCPLPTATERRKRRRRRKKRRSRKRRRRSQGHQLVTNTQPGQLVLLLVAHLFPVTSWFPLRPRPFTSCSRQRLPPK